MAGLFSSSLALARPIDLNAVQESRSAVSGQQAPGVILKLYSYVTFQSDTVITLIELPSWTWIRCGSRRAGQWTGNNYSWIGMPPRRR